MSATKVDAADAMHDDLSIRIPKPKLRGRIGFECDYSLPVDRAPKPFSAERPLSAELKTGLAKARIQGATFGFDNALETSAPPLSDNMLLMLACALIGVTMALVLAAIP